jgi:S1-C subfamily serine protease
VDGDTLKISVNRRDAGVKERPLDFETKDNPGRRLLILKREKAGADDGTKDAPGFVGMQITLDKDTNKVLVTGLIEGSPAKKSGLKKDDAVLRVGTTDASDLKTTIDAVRLVRPGSDLTLRVERDGKELDIRIRVGVLPFFLFDF